MGTKTFSLALAFLGFAAFLLTWGIIATIHYNDQRNAEHRERCDAKGGTVVQLYRTKVCNVPGVGTVDGW